MRFARFQPHAAAAATAVFFTAAALSNAWPASATTIGTDQQLTRDAARIVGEANAASSAIAAKNVSAADTDIGQALRAQAQMATLARDHGLSMIVPVYTELDDTAVLYDAVHHRSNVSATGQRKTLPIAVKSNRTQITYVALDLAKAKTRLDAAKLALHDNNRQAAQDSLAAIGSDLITGRVATAIPLLTARQNLALAQHALQSKNYSMASADLQQAARSLDRYARAHGMRDAHRLAANIDAAIPLTTHTPQMMHKIDGWWTSLKNWFTHVS